MSASRFPFPRYPNGWFQVAYSKEIEPGTVHPLKYFGRDLVLFRTEAGDVNVLDAHCPHMGAPGGSTGRASVSRCRTRRASRRGHAFERGTCAR
jgi:nitrite reductase/ring-hydroxylating ferredoxin subunit